MTSAIGLYDEELDHPVPRDEPAAHRRMLSRFANSYRELHVRRAPQPISLVGARATDSEWRYLHELDDGRSWLLRIRSLVVFRAPRVHTLYFADDDKEPCVPPATFDECIRTIRYRAARNLTDATD